MKTKINLLAILLFTGFIFTISTSNAQIRGNGNVISEERTVGSFTGIDLGCSADVYITKGNSNTITVKADENLLPIISTNVSDGVLEIGTKKSFRNAKKLEVHVSMNNIDKINISGSGNVSCTGTIPGNNLNAHINGSGDLQGDFDVKNMELKINGSGDVEASGIRGELKIIISGSGDVEMEDLQLETCYLKVMGSGDVQLKGSTVDFTGRQNGSGDVNAYNLKAVNVTVNNSGSGDIVIHAIESLDVSLNGSGDLTYTGSPKVNIEANGSGEVYSK